MSKRWYELAVELDAVTARNAADYEAVAQMTGATVAEVEADTCAPDPGAEDEEEANMTWQLDNSGGNFWMIRTAVGELVATVLHCDLATARLLATALEMRGELVALAGAVADFHMTGPDDRSVKEWEASGLRMLAARQRALRLAAGTEEE